MKGEGTRPRQVDTMERKYNVENKSDNALIRYRYAAVNGAMMWTRVSGELRHTHTHIQSQVMPTSGTDRHRRQWRGMKYAHARIGTPRAVHRWSCAHNAFAKGGNMPPPFGERFQSKACGPLARARITRQRDGRSKCHAPAGYMHMHMGEHVHSASACGPAMQTAQRCVSLFAALHLGNVRGIATRSPQAETCHLLLARNASRRLVGFWLGQPPLSALPVLPHGSTLNGGVHVRRKPSDLKSSRLQKWRPADVGAPGAQPRNATTGGAKFPAPTAQASPSAHGG